MGETEAEGRGRCRQLPNPGRAEPGSTGCASWCGQLPPPGAGTGIPVGTTGTGTSPRPGDPRAPIAPPFPQQLIGSVNGGVEPCKTTGGDEPPPQQAPEGGGRPRVGVPAYPEVLSEVGHLGGGGDGGAGTRSSAPGALGTHLALTGGVRHGPPRTTPAPAAVYRFCRESSAPWPWKPRAPPCPPPPPRPPPHGGQHPGGGQGGPPGQRWGPTPDTQLNNK